MFLKKLTNIFNKFKPNPAFEKGGRKVFPMIGMWVTHFKKQYELSAWLTKATCADSPVRKYRVKDLAKAKDGWDYKRFKKTHAGIELDTLFVPKSGMKI